jgi:hypothetical protein
MQTVRTRLAVWIGDRARIQSHAPVMMLLVLLLAGALAVPNTGATQGLRAFVMQATAFGLLALLLARTTWSPAGGRRFLSTGPNLALLLLVGWAVVSFVLTAPDGGRGRNIAVVELMRLASGAAIYFAALYHCHTRSHLRLASLLLPGGGILAATAGLLSYWATGKATGAYGNSQLATRSRRICICRRDEVPPCARLSCSGCDYLRALADGQPERLAGQHHRVAGCSSAGTQKHKFRGSLRSGTGHSPLSEARVRNAGLRGTFPHVLRSRPAGCEACQHINGLFDGAHFPDEAADVVGLCANDS